MVDPLVVACMAFGLVLVLILIGFPIGIALGLVGVVGCFVAQGSASILAMTPFKAMDSFVLTALPLFIFMGQIFLVSGASEMVYKGASQVLSWAPGGFCPLCRNFRLKFCYCCNHHHSGTATIGETGL